MGINHKLQVKHGFQSILSIGTYGKPVFCLLEELVALCSWRSRLVNPVHFFLWVSDKIM